MEMGYRYLDLTIVCAEGLKDVNFFTAMDVYVVVQLLGHGSRENKKRTNIDRNGGTNPRWNHRIKFSIDEPSLKNNPTLSVLFQLKSERIFWSDKIIGEVTIPMVELYDDWVGADNTNSERVVDYQVRTSSRKPKGILKISYKFGENHVDHHPPPPPTEDNYKSNVNYGVPHEPVTTFPCASGSSMPHGAGMGYPAAYPPPDGYGGYPYPPQAPAGYPPAAGSYHHRGYAVPGPAGGYGYPPPPIMQQQQPTKKNKGRMGLGMGMGAGLGLGLGAGLLGGMLVEDMVSDVGEMAAYSDGYSDAMGMGDVGFDF